MSEVLFGKVIGRGMERICYANPNNPKTCFKVSRLGHDIQSRREIHYFDFLKKRNISADFLPEYYGYRKTKEFTINSKYKNRKEKEIIIIYQVKELISNEILIFNFQFLMDCHRPSAFAMTSLGCVQWLPY